MSIEFNHFIKSMQVYFFRYLGSEYSAVTLVNLFTLTSIGSMSCYIYGRRHIRHAGAFQRIIYPAFASIFFNMASHFGWAYIKEVLSDQDCFDYHWKVVCGLLSGGLFLFTGRNYLRFIDHWQSHCQNSLVLCTSTCVILLLVAFSMF